jgi:hypothetical protein
LKREKKVGREAEMKGMLDRTSTKKECVVSIHEGQSSNEGQKVTGFDEMADGKTLCCSPHSNAETGGKHCDRVRNQDRTDQDEPNESSERNAKDEPLELYHVRGGS